MAPKREASGTGPTGGGRPGLCSLDAVAPVLGGAFAFDQPFTLTVTELEMQEDGSWTVKEPVSSVLEPGTPAAETVREALEGYSYHLCLSSLAGDRLVPIGEQSVFLDSVSDGKKDHLGLIAGSNRLGCGDRVVQGYFRDSTVLCEQLSAILRGESGGCKLNPVSL